MSIDNGVAGGSERASDPAQPGVTYVCLHCGAQRRRLDRDQTCPACGGALRNVRGR